ncbi:hypothetical protein HD597_012335 [Nonomuraea thailandensis]|uniref:Uncharacterized protein n=1 Tax=Nonomuraea thailandensis TaxID=1188745 RepID=A0A9X2GWP9_9ACTN|nr:hypothetical protein [Nonomuraea thailandensis]MCP2365315.1 hypothetical protein [Nonomuraea thailandensis]
MASARRIHSALLAPNFRGGFTAIDLQQAIEQFAGVPVQSALPSGH